MTATFSLAPLRATFRTSTICFRVAADFQIPTGTLSLAEKLIVFLGGRRIYISRFCDFAAGLTIKQSAGASSDSYYSKFQRSNTIESLLWDSGAFIFPFC